MYLINMGYQSIAAGPAKQINEYMNDNYLAYMLRLKRGAGQANWRATLENAHSGSVHHFACEEELLLYLMDRLAGFPPASNETRAREGGDVHPDLFSD